MKTNRYISLSRFYAFALSCFFAFAFFSCSQEDFPPNEGEEYGYIITTVRTPRGGSALALPDASLPLHEQDHVLHSLRIFVFVGNQLETQSGVIRRGDPEWIAWEKYGYHRLQVTLGTKEILMVANETAAMYPRLNAVQTIGALHGVMADPIESVFIFDPNQGLPMTGSATQALIQENGIYSVTIPLTRMVARLDMTIIDGSEKGIEIYSVSLLNNKGRSLLWNVDGLRMQAADDDFFNIYFNVDGDGCPLADYTYDFAVDRTKVPNGNDFWEFPLLYLYENLHGGEDPFRRTELEIKARLFLEDYDDPSIRIPFYVIYRVFINEQRSVNSLPNDEFLIQRGHHYILTGTIWGTEYTHITVKMEAQPWQAGDSDPQRPLF